MKRITVRIDDETYEYLKTRQVSLSRWVRTAIRYVKSRNKKFLTYYKKRYASDPIFRSKEQIHQKDWNRRNKLKHNSFLQCK